MLLINLVDDGMTSCKLWPSRRITFGEPSSVRIGRSFGWVWLYGILTIVSYLIPNPLYTYVLNIYDLVWLGFMAN